MVRAQSMVSAIDGGLRSSIARSARTALTTCSAIRSAISGTRASTIAFSRSASG